LHWINRSKYAYHLVHFMHILEQVVIINTYKFWTNLRNTIWNPFKFTLFPQYLRFEFALLSVIKFKTAHCIINSKLFLKNKYHLNYKWTGYFYRSELKTWCNKDDPFWSHKSFSFEGFHLPNPIFLKSPYGNQKLSYTISWDSPKICVDKLFLIFF